MIYGVLVVLAYFVVGLLSDWVLKARG